MLLGVRVVSFMEHYLIRMTFGDFSLIRCPWRRHCYSWSLCSLGERRRATQLHPVLWRVAPEGISKEVALAKYRFDLVESLQIWRIQSNVYILSVELIQWGRVNVLIFKPKKVRTLTLSEDINQKVRTLTNFWRNWSIFPKKRYSCGSETGSE